MSSHRKRKSKEIVLKIGYKNKAVQGVTEQTRCGDLVEMVFRKSGSVKENGYSYDIYESGYGRERMLSDKTKILKTVRSWGSDSSFHFSLKAAKGDNKIFKTKEDKSGRNTERNSLNRNGRIENVGKLAHSVQSRKTRLQRNQASSQLTEVCNYGAETNIDEFITNVGHCKMPARFKFGGSVTSNELIRFSEMPDNAKSRKTANEGFVSGKEISKVDKINDVKYATKKVLKPKRVTVTYGHENTGMPRKHTFVDCEHKNIPLHSTPNRSSTQSLNRHERLADDITTKIARIDQKEGKDVILQKYFSDYLNYNSPHGKPFPGPKRQRGDGSSFTKGNPDKGDGTFSMDAPSLRRTTRARRHSDSDSGQEDHDHEDNFNKAFIFTAVTKLTNNNTRYAEVKSLSGKPVNNDVTMATQVEKLVDYSLSDSSILESDESSVDLAERNVFDEDEEMASFMDSKSHDDFSDEGLSSLGSDDEKEILV